VGSSLSHHAGAAAHRTRPDLTNQRLEIAAQDTGYSHQIVNRRLPHAGFHLRYARIQHAGPLRKFGLSHTKATPDNLDGLTDSHSNLIHPARIADAAR
jgi:hypothetical protein